MPLKRSFSFRRLRRAVGEEASYKLLEGIEGVSGGTYSFWEREQVRPKPEKLISFLRQVARKYGLDEIQFMEEQLNAIQRDAHLGVFSDKSYDGSREPRRAKPMNLAYVHELEKASDYMWMADISYNQPDHVNVSDTPIHPADALKDSEFTYVELESLLQNFADEMSNSVKQALKPLLFKYVTSQMIMNSLQGCLHDGCLSKKMQNNLKRQVLPVLTRLGKERNKEFRRLAELLKEPLQLHNKLVAAGDMDSFELCEGFEAEHERYQELKDLGFPWSGEDMQERMVMLLASPLEELRALPESSVDREVYVAIIEFYSRRRRSGFSGEFLIAVSVITRTPLKQLFLGMMEQNRLVNYSSMALTEVRKIVRALYVLYGLDEAKLLRMWSDSIPPLPKYKNDN